MSVGERKEFLAWYERHKSEPFDNRYVLEAYCQDYVTVLRKACGVFRREFLHIGKIEVSLESLAIASAWYKVLQPTFLKPDAIGLIPTGGYTCDNKYNKKAIMWLFHMGQADGVFMKHARNRCEYRLPELPHLSADGYCVEINKIYEYFGCYWLGYACKPFRDVITTNCDTLPARYEQTMVRLEQTTCVG